MSEIDGRVGINDSRCMHRGNPVPQHLATVRSVNLMATPLMAVPDRTLTHQRYARTL